MENQNKQESIDPERSREGTQRDATSYGIDKNRRKFLAVMLIGSGTFLIEKFLDPLFSKFLNNNPPVKTDLTNQVDLESFKITKDKKVLSVYNNSGEEVFQIDEET